MTVSVVAVKKANSRTYDGEISVLGPFRNKHAIDAKSEFGVKRT